MQFTVLEKRVEKPEVLVIGKNQESLKDKIKTPVKSNYVLAPISDGGYERHTAFYRDFLKELLSTPAVKQYQEYSPERTNQKREFKWGEELINYQERKEIARVVQMNYALGGNHNHLDPRQKELYEYWKLDKFNLSMSFWMFTKVLSA